MQNTLDFGDFGNASVRERFLRFHDENPHVYKALVGLARYAKKTGMEKAGMTLLYGGLRWQHATKIKVRRELGAPKLNNNYMAFYSRLIMQNESDLKDFFDTREGCHVDG